MNQWHRWANEVGIEEDIYEMSNSQFVLLLESFIAIIKQKKNPEAEYSNSGLKTMVSCLVRERNLNLKNGEKNVTTFETKCSNDVGQ